MDDKKKYLNCQSECETYINEIRDYCRQIKLNYNESNVFLRRNQQKQSLDINDDTKTRRKTSNINASLSKQSSMDNKSLNISCNINDRSLAKSKQTRRSNINKDDNNDTRFNDSLNNANRNDNKSYDSNVSPQRKIESAKRSPNYDDAHSRESFSKSSYNKYKNSSTSRNSNIASPKKTESISSNNDADILAHESNSKLSNKINNLRTSRTSNVTSPKKVEPIRKSVDNDSIDDDALAHELFSKTYKPRKNIDILPKSNVQPAIKKNFSGSLKATPSSPSKGYHAINKKLNEDDETKTQNNQPQIPKRKVRKPSVSITPVYDDDVRFIGKFDTVSNCNISRFPKCSRCKKDYEGEFEVIACPECKHWMHIECFVEHVYEQRGQGKRLSCPINECKKNYF